MNARDNPAFPDLLEAAMDSFLEECLPGSVKWNYETGLGLMAVLEASRRLSDSARIRAVEERIGALVRADGSIAGYRLDEYNVDQINAGKAVFGLWKITGQKKYWDAVTLLRRQMESHPRAPSGSFWHKKIYPNQIWLDGLYMFGPFLARYAAETGDAALLGDVCAQVLRIRDSMRDSLTGLYFHAKDESKSERWADPKSGLSSQFWGRAVGWLSMALPDILDWVPVDHPARLPVSAMSVDLAQALLKFRTSDGLWNQILDKPDLADNYPETSASAMFCYFFLKGTRTGLLNGSVYKNAAIQGIKAINRSFVSWETRRGGGLKLHLGGICKVAGLGGFPYRDGSVAYYLSEPVVSDDFKGLGPFILALGEALSI